MAARRVFVPTDPGLALHDRDDRGQLLNVPHLLADHVVPDTADDARCREQGRWRRSARVDGPRAPLHRLERSLRGARNGVVPAVRRGQYPTSPAR